MSAFNKQLTRSKIKSDMSPEEVLKNTSDLMAAAFAAVRSFGPDGAVDELLESAKSSALVHGATTEPTSTQVVEASPSSECPPTLETAPQPPQMTPSEESTSPLPYHGKNDYQLYYYHVYFRFGRSFQYYYYHVNFRFGASFQYYYHVYFRFDVIFQ